MFNVLFRHPGHGWIEKSVPDKETLKKLLDKGGSVLDDQQWPILLLLPDESAAPAPVADPAPAAAAPAPAAPAPAPSLPRVGQAAPAPASSAIPPGFKLVPADAVILAPAEVLDPNARFFTQAPAAAAAPEPPAPKLI